MKDMLVRLYDLPDFNQGAFERNGVKVKKAIAPEKSLIIEFVKNNFSIGWADECETALSKTPTTCFIAYIENDIVGFSCYHATALNFFGPTGVLDTFQGLGIGKALLLEALFAMKNEGYAYAIIGGVGPEKFYEKIVGASVIEYSSSGVYKDMIRK